MSKCGVGCQLPFIPGESENCAARIKPKGSRRLGAPDLQDAQELVEEIGDKMHQITSVIRGMDKRMSYNLRLINTTIIKNKSNENSSDEKKKGPVDEDYEELMQLIKKKSTESRMARIGPKIKKMKNYTYSRLKE